jgi:frataxin
VRINQTKMRAIIRSLLRIPKTPSTIPSYTPFTTRTFHATPLFRVNEQFPFSQSEYLHSLQHTLENISDLMDTMMDSGQLSALIDQSDAEVDIEISDGVLNLHMGDSGTFVVSRQTPSRQLWLSSPVSGPWHYTYDHVSKNWICTKGQLNFFERMENELSQVLGQNITLKRI